MQTLLPLSAAMKNPFFINIVSHNGFNKTKKTCPIHRCEAELNSRSLELLFLTSESSDDVVYRSTSTAETHLKGSKSLDDLYSNTESSEDMYAQN